jgi:hypothetical protein
LIKIRKQEARDSNQWRSRFGRGYGRFVWQTAYWWWMKPRDIQISKILCRVLEVKETQAILNYTSVVRLLSFCSLEGSYRQTPESELFLLNCDRIRGFQTSSAKHVFNLDLSLRQDMTSFCQFNPHGVARQF